MSISHSFSIELAKKIGLKEAILLSHLFFWCKKNRGNNKHFYKNNWWTYNTRKGFAEYFEYMTEGEIRGAMNNLYDKGYVIKDNFNDTQYDRTSWYAITYAGLSELILDKNELESWFIIANNPIGKINQCIGKINQCIGKISQPIPDNNTDNNTDTTSSSVSQNQEICNTKNVALQDSNTSKEYEIITAYIRATFDASEDKLCCYSQIKNVICGGSLTQDLHNFTIGHIEENIEKWGFTQGSIHKRGAMDEARTIKEVIGDKSYDEFYNAFYAIQSKRCQKDSPFYLANFASNELGVLKGLLKIDFKKDKEAPMQNKQIKKTKKQLEEDVIIMQDKIKQLLNTFPEAVLDNTVKKKNEFHEMHCQKIINFVIKNNKTPFDSEDIILIQENDEVLVRYYSPYIKSPSIESLIIQYFNNIRIEKIKFQIATKVNYDLQKIQIPDLKVIQPIINEFLKTYDVLLHKDFVINEFINMHTSIRGSDFAEKNGRQEANVFLNMLEENNQHIGLNIFVNTILHSIVKGQEARKILSPIDIYSNVVANWTYFLNFV